MTAATGSISLAARLGRGRIARGAALGCAAAIGWALLQGEEARAQETDAANAAAQSEPSQTGSLLSASHQASAQQGAASSATRRKQLFEFDAAPLDEVFEDPISDDSGQSDDGETGAETGKAAQTDSDGNGAPAAGSDSGQNITGLSGVETGRQQREAAEGPVPDPESGEPPRARSNLRADAVEKGTARRAETDPFLPQGFRAGSWLAFSSLESAIGYATNSAFSAGGKPGAFATTDANFRLQSDWSRHQAQVEFGGTWRRGFAEGDTEIPTANAAGQLRLDLIDGYTATLRAGYDFSTEAVSAPELGAGVVNRPGVHGIAASAELARTGGRLEMTLRGSFDRTIHDDAELAGGGTLSQADRNDNLFEASARLGYSTGAALTPFVQAGIGRRLHDLATDRNGNRRDATVLDLRAGVEVDLDEKLNGEMAIGYLAESYEDARLATLDAVSVNGALDWSPERDTTIRFGASTNLSQATALNQNGYANYSFSLEARRRLRDNLALNARAAVDLSRADADGALERTTTLSTGFEYWLNRFLAFTGKLEYQRLDSATAANSFEFDLGAPRHGVAAVRLAISGRPG